RRFLDERNILAKLEHANIARLLDGGITEDGTPYLVMQYVEGVPLDDWCSAKRLDAEARIRLMLKVCEAVEYAHEHLVVHRDLKPGNVLVTATGEPMLLDFGTARLLEHTEQSGATQTELPMLTARYASPEQVGGLAGSTRSDVYAMGVILYELLAGQWPYQSEGTGTPTLLRAVQEQEPRWPSRAAVNPAIARALRGDLDAILLRALEKSPERRYGTVRHLADDLRRHLSHEAVDARKPTWGYRAGRFLRRHRWAAGVAALVAISLAGATAYSVQQARVAERERVKAVQVAMFLERLLGASAKGGVSTLATGGRELKVVDVIEAAAANVGEEFRESPDVEVGLRSTIGSALMALGMAEKARPHVERAVELSAALYGDNHIASTRALSARGRLKLAAGDFAGAQADLERAVLWHEANPSADLSFQHSLLAEAYFRQADLQGARRHFELALASMRKEFGDHHITTATMINNLGVVTDDAGDAATAEKHFAEAAATLRSLPGPPGNLVYPLLGLERMHFFRGEYSKAMELGEEAYRHALKSSGERHPNSASARMMLAIVKAHAGDEGAEAEARETMELQRTIYPGGHVEIARGQANLARVLIVAGKAAEAVPLVREALPVLRIAYPKDNWRTAETQLLLGAALAITGSTKEGQEMLDAGLTEMRAVLPATHPRVQEAERIRAQCVQPAPSGCTHR
ncbi:MAG: serine/threonine protein kinase, partial [Bryobacterales bacterium]|nr:serine/threonine protein kinase [Bryobacterales bacterium]